MLISWSSTRTLSFRAAGMLMWLAVTAQPHTGSAQSTSFIADTLLSPSVFVSDPGAFISDYRIDNSGIIGFLDIENEVGKLETWVVRCDAQGSAVDTLFPTTSIPKRRYHHFDSHGQVITFGFGFDILYHRFLITSENTGNSWDVVDIGDTAYYLDLKILDAETWLLESESPFTGWRFVTRDTAYWIFHRERTRSWIDLFHKDSLLLFVGDDRCGRASLPDTGYFQFIRRGGLADDMTPVIVSSDRPATLPAESVCPRLMFIGFDGKRIWFKREWVISYPDTQTNAFPTELYTYNLQTDVVQFENIIRHPRQPVRAVLFADHIFVSTDSQMVVRHVDAPPNTPLVTVPGINVGLGALQEHDGVLYGARSSGLIMRIRQVSSVPTEKNDQSVTFAADIVGGEIVVHLIYGAGPREIPLELFDIQGRRLSISRIASGTSSGRLPAPSVPGVYFLRCGSSEAPTTLRIVVP